MRIGIDISQIIYGTGVSVYTRELVTNLLRIDQENKYVLFGGSLRQTKSLRDFSTTLKMTNAETKILPLSPTLADLIWNRLHILNIEKIIGKIDVVHSSDWTQPPTTAFKVTTVHDLAPLKFPNETHKRIVEVHRRRLYWVLREVDRMIVPTNSTKNDLIELGADPKKIRVIYEAAGENFKKINNDEINQVKIKYGIHEDYIMTVGVGQRKNTKRLIEAYQKLKRKNLKLVVVGGKMNTNFEDRGVSYTGFVSDNELAALYSGARALVYPSLYEGFGLPLVQAMACNCPVVTSNIGSMKEVVRSAGILVDPYDINAIAFGIEKAIDGPKGLITKGLKRVKDFGWEKAARETLEVYNESGK